MTTKKAFILMRGLIAVTFLLSLIGVQPVYAGVLAQTSCTDVSLTAVEDTYLSSVNTGNNYGSVNLFKVSSDNATNRHALLRFDLSGIPSSATIQSASLGLYVSNPAAFTYNLYAMRRAWVEGTTNPGGASSTSATWVTYNGTNNWGTSGARSTTSDRYNTNLWGAGSTTFNSTGLKTVVLDDDGIAVVQDWVDGSLPNRGLTIQNYNATTSDNDLQISSSENTTVANRPKLNVNYCVTGPAISVSGSLNAFSAQPGVYSEVKSYTVAGADLSGDLVISAPADFQVSTSASSGFAASISLTPSGGFVPSTPIYVRFMRATAGTSSGNITHASAGATTQNLAVSGAAAYTDWTAYNDCAFISGQPTANITTYQCYTNATAGLLKNYADGSNTPVTVTIATSGTVNSQLDSSTYGSEPNTGTDGYTTFHNIASMVGGLWMGTTSSNVSLTFSGLDPTKTYSFATAANRNNPDYTYRATNYTISDADASVNASTGGVTVNSPQSVSIVTGYNTVNGFVARWIAIQPGADGDFRVSFTVDTSLGGTIAYGPAVFMLAQNSSSSTTPTITTSGALSAFSAAVGAYSAEQSYSVAGSNLSGNLTISAPADFEISTTSGSGFGASVTLTPSGGSVPSTPIYVRFRRTTAGVSSGNITHASAGAATVNVAVSGTAGTCSTANLNAVEDTWLRFSYPNNNYGGDTTIQVSPNTSYPQGTLIKWDLSSIPAGATVTGASLTLNVTDSTIYPFNLYQMLRAWVEGTSDDAASTTSANWNTYNGTSAWGSAGAQGAADRAGTNLWDTTVIGATGAQTRSLNASGMSVVQGWIDGAANHGLTIQNYTAADNSDYLIYSSSEGTVAPRLDVSYCVGAAGPTITTGGTLSAFSAAVGAYSAEQSYSVAGSNLSGNLTISAPADFEISTTSGSGFGASITLTPSGGSVASTPIYVRFRRMTAGTTNGNISHASAGAATVNVAVSGTAANGAPTVTPVSPADNATGVSLPPTLQAAVSDPDGDTLDVSFYGRPVGGGEEFMLALIPDSQNLDGAERNAQTGWIVSNKTANNIVFVTTAGDMVNTANSVSEYTIADAAIDLLDGGGVWYSVASGNHDYPGYASPLRYPDYFGAARYSDYEVGDGYWFGGAYNDYNTYSLFSAGGMDFILINLQYQPTTAVLDWADGLLSTYASRRAIVEQHDILNVDNSWVNQASFNALRDHANLFMMLSGHMHTGSDGAAYRQETGTDGHTIHVVMADYQDYNSAGNTGYLRLFRFAPADDMIYMTTYSPVSSTALTSTGNYDQADLAYAMDGGAAFALIGTANDVASGATASISWPGLLNDTEYEWYAVADDGSTTTTGATWSFTTGVGNNQPPVISEGTAAAVTMSEDGAPTAFSLTLHAGDANPGDTLTWSIVDAADSGTATAAGTGFSKAIGYAPNANYNGSDSFTVQVSDGYPGGTDTIVVHVTIEAVNDTPVADPQSVSTAFNTAKAITLSGSDVETPDLTFAVVDPPDHGGLSGTPPNLTYTPTGGYSGADSFTFTTNDGALTSLPATVAITVEDPLPVLPSSFYGEIHIFDNPPAAGGTVEAHMPGVAGPAATAIITLVGGNLTYALNVPAGDKGIAAEGDAVTFRIGGRVVATAVWHTGTNVELNLHPPQALPGGPYSGIAGAAVSFSASANDWGSDALTYEWDWNNDGVYDQSGQAASHTWAAQGSYSVGLRVTDAQGGVGTATAAVEIGPAYVTHSINLVPGWNLISFNVQPLDTATGAVLADLGEKYTLVYAWDAHGGHTSAGNWTRFDRRVDPIFNTLTNLNEKTGFWIYMLEADTLDVTGLAPTTSDIELVTTVGGWNLVGYPAAAAGALPGIVEDHGVGENYTLIFAYHPEDTLDPWKLYDPLAPLPDLTSLTAGWGYWIYVTSDNLTWSVAY